MFMDGDYENVSDDQKVIIMKEILNVSKYAREVTVLNLYLRKRMSLK